MDEEHDASYKQDESIYNARDMQFPEQILKNSDPSFIVLNRNYNNISKKKYRHVKILKRFDNYPLQNNKFTFR